MKAFVVTAFVLAACPSSPGFEQQDSGSGTRVDSVDDTAVDSAVVDTVIDALDTSATTDIADVMADTAEVLVPTGVPCDRDCLVDIGDDGFAPFIAAHVGADGHARAAHMRDDGESYSLLVWTYADGGWTEEVVASDVLIPSEIAFDRDAAGRLHILLERGDFETSATSWYRQTDDGWAVGPLLAAPRCERPSLFRAGDALYGGCVVIDELALSIMRLDGDVWAPFARLDDIGRNQSGTPRVSTTVRWTIDADTRAQVAYRCCSSAGGDLIHASFDGESWDRDSVHTFEATEPEQHTRFAIDDRGYPHIVHAENDAVGADHIYDRYRDAQQWQRVIVTEATSPDERLAAELLDLRADSVGALHVVYPHDDELHYRRLVDGLWSRPVVCSRRTQGYFAAALVIDADDRPHVVIANGGTLRWWTPAEPEP